MVCVCVCVCIPVLVISFLYFMENVLIFYSSIIFLLYQKHTHTHTHTHAHTHTHTHSHLRSVSGAAGRQWGKVCVAPDNHGVCNHGDDVMSAGGCCRKEKLRLLQPSTAANLTHTHTHTHTHSWNNTYMDQILIWLIMWSSQSWQPFCFEAKTETFQSLIYCSAHRTEDVTTCWYFNI